VIRNFYDAGTSPIGRDELSFISTYRAPRNAT
jgi:hypothetical protein